MKQTKVISVTSGKGGVGKTLSTIHLGLGLKRQGYKVLIFDGDLGLANVDVLMGLECRYSISDVLDGHARIDDVIVKSGHGLDVLPSGSGLAQLSDGLSTTAKVVLEEHLRELDGRYDVMLIDTGAGIGNTVVHFSLGADRVLVVTTPEPHAACDAYALIKVLNEQHRISSFSLLINQARNEIEGLKLFERLSEVAMRFLDAKLSYVGTVPYDPKVSKSVMARQAASETATNTISGQAWSGVARRLADDIGSQRGYSAVGRGVEKKSTYWHQYLWTNGDLVKGGVP